MKLYKISVEKPSGGRIVVWEGTQHAAKVIAKRLRLEHPDFDMPVVVEGIEFPTDKPGLLVYLNEHFNRDNG